MTAPEPMADPSKYTDAKVMRRKKGLRRLVSRSKTEWVPYRSNGQNWARVEKAIMTTQSDPFELEKAFKLPSVGGAMKTLSVNAKGLGQIAKPKLSMANKTVRANTRAVGAIGANSFKNASTGTKLGLAGGAGVLGGGAGLMSSRKKEFGKAADVNQSEDNVSIASDPFELEKAFKLPGLGGTSRGAKKSLKLIRQSTNKPAWGTPNSKQGYVPRNGSSKQFGARLSDAKAREAAAAKGAFPELARSTTPGANAHRAVSGLRKKP